MSGMLAGIAGSGPAIPADAPGPATPPGGDRAGARLPTTPADHGLVERPPPAPHLEMRSEENLRGRYPRVRFRACSMSGELASPSYRSQCVTWRFHRSSHP